MLLRITLISNSSVQGHRLLRSTFNIAYSANHSSRRNCLRRSCTLSGAVHRTVRSSSLQLHVQSSSLIQQLHNINRHFVFVSRVQQCRTPSTNCTTTISNSIDQLYEVLFRRTPINTRPRQFARLYVRQQCRTLSTIVITMVPLFNNAELHRQSTSSQQCRTPSTIQADPSYVQS